MTQPAKKYAEYVVVEQHKGAVTGMVTVRADDDVAALVKAREELTEWPTYEVKEVKPL